MALAAPKRSTPLGHWQTRTEEDLLTYEFTTKEPEKLEGMSVEPPPPGEFVIDLAYDLSNRAAGRVRCVHCKYPNHFRGLVIRFADGSRRLVGKDCGKKFYGGVFEELHREFETARDLASSLRRRRKLLAAEAILRDGVAQLINHRALRLFSRMALSVQSALGDEIVAELESIAKKGGDLTVPQKVRDFAAEERSHEEIAPEHAAKLALLNKPDQRRYRRRHNLPNAEIYAWLTKPVGVLKGASLLGSDPSARIGRLEIDIANCFGGLKQNRRWSSNALSDASRRLGDLVTRLEQEAQKFIAPVEFFEQSHLIALCEWAKYRRNPVTLGCGTRWIEGENEFGNVVRAEYLIDYEVPTTDFIDAFRKVVTEPRNK